MRLWDWFTSGPRAAEKVLDGAISGIDKIVFTEEEKADMRAKLGDQWVELQKVLSEESTTRSVTRRILAVLIIVPFVLTCVGSSIAYPFNADYANFLWDVAEGAYGTFALMIGAFYFGPYMIGQVASAFRKPQQLAPNGNGNGNGH